ncbi:MAG: hypothetical protein N3D15_06115 [Syntrophorhabdaceae bacterium]|nr:hypothetical protein [Syntrophorhabdaceae bacterium]
MEDLLTYAALIIILYGLTMLLMPYIKIFFFIVIPISIALLLIYSMIYRYFVKSEEKDEIDLSSDIRLSLLLKNHD